MNCRGSKVAGSWICIICNKPFVPDELLKAQDRYRFCSPDCRDCASVAVEYGNSEHITNKYWDVPQRTDFNYTIWSGD